jgi:hypothetical protein
MAAICSKDALQGRRMGLGEELKTAAGSDRKGGRKGRVPRLKGGSRVERTGGRRRWLGSAARGFAMRRVEVQLRRVRV